MSVMASQITNVMTVYPTVYSGTGQRKRQSSASGAFVRGIHRWTVNSPHKGPVTREMFPFDDVIMIHGMYCTTWTINTARPCNSKLYYGIICHILFLPQHHHLHRNWNQDIKIFFLITFENDVSFQFKSSKDTHVVKMNENRSWLVCFVGMSEYFCYFP